MLMISGLVSCGIGSWLLACISFALFVLGPSSWEGCLIPLLVLCCFFFLFFLSDLIKLFFSYQKIKVILLHHDYFIKFYLNVYIMH